MTDVKLKVDDLNSLIDKMIYYLLCLLPYSVVLTNCVTNETFTPISLLDFPIQLLI